MLLHVLIACGPCTFKHKDMHIGKVAPKKTWQSVYIALARQFQILGLNPRHDHDKNWYIILGVENSKSTWGDCQNMGGHMFGILLPLLCSLLPFLFVNPNLKKPKAPISTKWNWNPRCWQTNVRHWRMRKTISVKGWEFLSFLGMLQFSSKYHEACVQNQAHSI